ncbi:MAG: Imm7 family immunity protein [Pirellulales bacterium]
MFEFHGWATIEVDDTDDPDLSVIRARKEKAVEQLQIALTVADDDFSWFELRTAGNGLTVLSAQGLRNHRYEPVIDLFRWVARNLPFAYGLLYVRDDEDRGDRGSDNSNCFRVWRIARGMFEEMTDPFLSPCIPTVEPPWEWASDN